MSDIKLFRLDPNGVTEIQGQSVAVEKSLQVLIEKHLNSFFGVRFLATEFSTGRHGGRVDTLGLDENGCPVIIEYKRSLNQNVINQGLFYLDWLLDHKGDFTLLVQKKLGQLEANTIEWPSPRLICIAGDFTKYDEHAVQQINRNIELIRYRRYDSDLLVLELVNATTQAQTADSDGVGTNGLGTKTSKGTTAKTVTDLLAQANTKLTDWYEGLKAYLTALGDDVQVSILKHYVAFKRIKNFACVEVHPSAGKLLVYVKVEPHPDILEKGFTRDVSGIGHYGTGDLEITISSDEQFEKAKPLLLKSYDAS